PPLPGRPRTPAHNPAGHRLGRGQRRHGPGTPQPSTLGPAIPPRIGGRRTRKRTPDSLFRPHPPTRNNPTSNPPHHTTTHQPHPHGNSDSPSRQASPRPEGPARFSFPGAPTGEILTYRHTERTAHVHHANGTQSQEPGTIFEALDQRLPDPIHSDLPFDFTGG